MALASVPRHRWDDLWITGNYHTFFCAFSCVLAVVPASFDDSGRQLAQKNSAFLWSCSYFRWFAQEPHLLVGVALKLQFDWADEPSPLIFLVGNDPTGSRPPQANGARGFFNETCFWEVSTMYSAVLVLALAGGAETPDCCNWGSGGCCGISQCGCSGNYGWGGCCGISQCGCSGNYGWGGCYGGCYGGYVGGCYGGGAYYGMPAARPGEKIAEPKSGKDQVFALLPQRLSSLCPPTPS